MTISDEAIKEALTRVCDTCGVSAGWECYDISDPHLMLVDVTGVPVHDRRVGDQ